MNKLWVYLPCYNEEENIKELSLEWIEQKQKLEEKGYSLGVVIIDDKSTDKTLKIAKELTDEYEEISFIFHETNKNLGGGLNTAVDSFLALAQKEDLMCVMDGDNTQKPQYVLSMVDEISKGADCVIASRYQKGASVNGVPLIRRFLSDGAKLYYTLVLHVPRVKDYTCGYRVYNFASLKKAKEKYGSNLIVQKTFSCMMELLYKLYKSGAVFSEVPFDLHYDDKKGESKMKVIKTVKDSFITAMKLRIQTK